MNKKIYEGPRIDIIKFNNQDNTNVDTSALQTSYKKNSYADVINEVNVIEF